MLAASGVVRVLYVDDDPGISRLVRKHLERAGYVVTVAADGTAGIALVGSGHFDVIALDH
jgi:DNA-binding response OmpR family regulator